MLLPPLLPQLQVEWKRGGEAEVKGTIPSEQYIGQALTVVVITLRR